MADDMGERTEQPTPKKISDARNKGNLARSLDLAAAVNLSVALLLVWFLGGSLVRELAEIMTRALGDPTLAAFTALDGWRQVGQWVAARAVWLLVPFMALLWVAAYLVQLHQVRLLWTLEPLKAKLERLNPVSGVKRLLSRKNLVKTVVNIAKLTIAIAVVALVVRAHLQEIAGLPALGGVEALAVVGRHVLETALYLLAVLLVIGLIDWYYQQWQHLQDLRMTRQEVKDEQKTNDGNPEVKARRMRIAREIALQRARHEVPRADVVVTNPTHVAVALRYDAQRMAAPVVVARGEDWMAFRIREIAAAHGVPIVERPALARALYATVKVGQMVRPELFEAVAEVLAYVYRLSRRVTPTSGAAPRSGEGEARPRVRV
jgi:flagellar biosynthetic protein FlhB